MKKITLLLIATLVVMTAGNLSAQAPIAHFKFDGNLVDFRGNFTINTTTNTNHPASFTYVTGHDGTLNGAVMGIGVSEYFETNENVNITGAADRTVSAWIKTSAGTNGTRTQRGIVKWGNEAAQQKFTLMLINNRLRNEIQTGGVSAPANGTLINGVWRHVAAVYDNATNTSTVYMDGVEVVDKAWGATTLVTVAAPLWIGNDSGNSGERGFEGAIDDVEIYSAALTLAQIQTLFTGGTLSNKKVSSTSVKVYPNPVQDQLVIDNDEVATVEICDIMGRKLSTNTVINGRLSLGNLSKGIYVLTCKDDQDNYMTSIEVIKE